MFKPGAKGDPVAKQGRLQAGPALIQMMRIYTDHTSIPDADRGAIAALGNFDGIHPGHRAVIEATRREAERLERPLAVITFEPHTREFFRPDDPPFRLTSLNAKARILEAMGVEILYVLRFDRAMATLSAEDFAAEILAAGLGVRHVVIGADFRFGRNRKGDRALLEACGEKLGFGTTVVEMIRGPGQAGGRDAFSSTLIRQALRRGDVGRATDLLGRPWSIEGVVVHGDQRGRAIGFPTANLRMDGYLRPALGVYAVRVVIPKGPDAGLYDGVANLGNRPTFGKSDVILEAHLFDYDGDLYDRQIIIYFHGFLRPERKFDGLEALTTQITADCAAARDVLAHTIGQVESLPR